MLSWKREGEILQEDVDLQPEQQEGNQDSEVPLKIRVLEKIWESRKLSPGFYHIFFLPI